MLGCLVAERLARSAAAAVRVPARRRATHPAMPRCLPRATARWPGATSEVMVEPAATYEPSPTVTPPMSTESLPTKLCSPTVVCFLVTPS